ncbi:FtsW/RodA/SpoVE family cell cycle protein [Aquibaculum arenosum]|uniref:Probable peptidoglycan glycosyltransferase FtsW n=1 Tax=Aquibaculum arenosum TaxID=3032591 RepID=A0ABT5YQX2_9PROT|nr:putative peptidoglycan glycosyltransferase FtsW [Fodinicurvata sp. CAU 1616]MDF2097218.1 putative peptidoglycan glycosyltransferase FtsW [Fodinicurvata sp. CAU 1616]
MSLAFDRTDTSLLGRWWWSVDRWALFALVLLVAVGAILSLTASPAVSMRLGLGTFGLAKRHLVMLPLAAALLLGVSLASPLWVRRFSVFGLLGTLVLLVAVLFLGPEIKGATRWISIAGFSLQPSEFVKPFFAVVAAWLLALGRYEENFPGKLVAGLLWLLISALLLLQPDLGQTVLVAGVFGLQLFLAGLPWILVAALAAVALSGVVGAYMTLPHVAQRIDAFFDPTSGDGYQIGRSMEAFMNGGLWGRGPGEGTVKAYLPDAHSDFVFAVAGEELGIIACLIIACLFAFVVLRGFTRLLREESLFVVLAGTGLLAQFGFQALVNMGSTLHLLPTKGMTLPFLSYGGSSLLALAMGMGMVLALTRRRHSVGGPML